MNKKETVYEALTNVKREYVEEAERFDFKKRRISWQRVLSMAAAACLVVAMAAIAIMPKRERNPWAANAPTNAPTETGAPITTGAPMPDASGEKLVFVGRNKLCDIPMVEFSDPNTSFGIEGKLGYFLDPSGNIGPAQIVAASDDEFLILDQVGKQLLTVGRDGSISTQSLYFTSAPRALAHEDGQIVILDAGELLRFNRSNIPMNRGDAPTIPPISLDSHYPPAVLYPNGVMALPLPEEHRKEEWNYGTIPLRFAGGKLYYEASKEKAYFVDFDLIIAGHPVGSAEDFYRAAFTETPVMPRVTRQGGSIEVEGWGRSWSVEADLITPIDAYDDLLLAQTAVGASVRDVKTSVGLYSSETDASCSMEIDTENRLLPAQFAMSPSGRVYMIEFCENNAQIYELEYARVIDVTDDPDAPKLLEPGAENLLYFTDLDALKAFLASPELSDEEFEQFVSEKLDPAMGIVTKEDARAVIGRIEQIPFPMTADLEPSGFKFYFYNKSEANYLYSIEYSMPDGGVCSFFGQLEGEYSLAKDIEAYASSASPVDFEGNAFVNRLYYESFGDVQAFYADIGGRIVNAQFRNLTYDEALEALSFFAFGKAAELIGDGGQTQSELASDPWYLEKAWEYAEFANREYGFGFTKENPEFSAWDKRISFTHYESEDSEGQHISIYFKRDAKEVSYVEIYGDRSDRPEEYASMSDEELRALYDTLSLISTYTVTREDMLQAGYTLDDTDEDYVKIAEYCGKLKAAELMNCNELHYNHCIKVDVGNAQRNTEPSVKDSTDPVYCWVTYYFRPSYPKLFTLYHVDIGCSMIPLDDAEHPGWIDFWGDVLISETADGWSCELAYISGY